MLFQGAYQSTLPLAFPLNVSHLKSNTIFVYFYNKNCCLNHIPCFAGVSLIQTPAFELESPHCKVVILNNKYFNICNFGICFANSASSHLEASGAECCLDNSFSVPKLEVVMKKKQSKIM